MGKKHKRLAFLISTVVTVVSLAFKFDYKNIASEGLTLSSIVLAIYVAAMMGLAGSKLGEKLATAPAADGEHTQLWIMRAYFEKALIYAGITIILSSIALLLPDMDYETARNLSICLHRLFSAVGLVVYALNLFYMGIILVFMLNRQIWNT